MKKFIAIYHAPAEALAANADATPEQKEAGMKAWFDWKEKFPTNVEELGAPLGGGTSIFQDGSTADSSKEVAGYSIITATDKEAALAVFKGHPHLSWHPEAYVEIHEVMKM